MLNVEQAVIDGQESKKIASVVLRVREKCVSIHFDASDGVDGKQQNQLSLNFDKEGLKVLTELFTKLDDLSNVSCER